MPSAFVTWFVLSGRSRRSWMMRMRIGPPRVPPSRCQSTRLSGATLQHHLPAPHEDCSFVARSGKTLNAPIRGSWWVAAPNVGRSLETGTILGILVGVLAVTGLALSPTIQTLTGALDAQLGYWI